MATSRIPPHSAEYEERMLGAAMLAESARIILADDLDPSDFYLPKHGHIAGAIQQMHRIDHATDPVTVAAWLDARGLLEVSGGVTTLIHYLSNAPSTGAAPTYAKTIRALAARRRLLGVLGEASEKTYDLSEDIGDVADWVRSSSASVDIPDQDESPVLNIDEFLALPRSYDWLVPDLLERGDRMILTASEGGGKSYLLRQLALQLAAGIHPFKPHKHSTPITVLLVDLENSEMQVHRKFERMMHLVRPIYQPVLDDIDRFDPSRLRIEVRNQGIDLLKRTDRRWFSSRVAKVEPDLIITGPVYKMHDGDPNAEEPAHELAGYLDDLRAAYGCAIMLEAHSPHGNDGGFKRTLRPIGASLWRRWPEFGYGLREDGGNDGAWDWEAWRPPRDDDRDWPVKLRRSATSWPWVNYYGRDDEQLALAANAPRNGFLRPVPNSADPHF